MSAIFLSHSSKDNHIAEVIAKKLAADGHRSIFLDFDPSNGIPAGRDWEQELYRQLRACQAVIVLCSQHSMTSQWCFAEITHAKALGKPIFPAKIGACEINTILTSRQMLDFTAKATDAYERLRRGLKAAGLDPASAFDWDNSRAPYPGLLAFDEADAAVYFGRDGEIQQALELLNRRRQFGGPRMLVVLGASGSGKSSLVRAGLIPRLRNNQDDWLVVDPFRPRDDPFRELAVALAASCRLFGSPRNADQLCEALKAGGSHLAGAAVVSKVAADLQSACGRRDATVLVTIDQMEELLGASAHGGFLNMLQHVLRERGTPLMVVGTLRSDFLAELQSHPAMRDLRFDTLPLGPMTTDSLTQVIEGPAQKAALDLERGLTQMLIRHTETENALPLLAFTLRELYERHGGDGRLTVDEYSRQLGGLTGSVARSAEAVFEAEPLSEGQVGELRLAFLSMVRVNQEGQFARQPAKWDEMPEGVRGVLERFVRARLLVVRGEGADRIVEVAHESIFRAWDRLKGWLAADREFLLWRKRLGSAVAEWQRVGQDRSALLVGPALGEARGWLQREANRLGPDERDFLGRSVRAGDAERRRKRMIAVGTIAASLVVAAGGVYLWQREKSALELVRAEQKRTEDALQVAQDEQRKQMEERAKREQAEGEADQARRSEIETNVNLAWAGLNDPTCDPGETVLAGGLRALNCAVSPYMSLERLASLSGQRIFLRGPHSPNKLNLKAKEFGYYNRDFVKWAAEWLIPAKPQGTQAIYDKFARRTARIYYLAYLWLQQNPKVFDKVVDQYRRGRVPERYQETMFWDSLGEVIPNDADIKDLPYPYTRAQKGQSGEVASYDACTAGGFWARRSIDGTAPDFMRALQKLLTTYDGDFIRRRKS